ncbi:MAG: DegT/DnrJ/EryC1/StrS aminotransferase family protein [Mariprofundaceae bacterium]|nr:DegT/DnrJ/EryC1/StrS aminotransferase family protein [Mariprofundaceae bacterium]
MIPHSRPVFGTAFADAVQQVVKSGQLATGKVCAALEAEVAGLIGVRYAVTVDSGTSALMLALYALKAKRKVRRVGIPAYACRAVLHAVRAVDAEPVCMDCNDDLRLDAEKARDMAESLDAVILVHPFGMIESMVKESWCCPVIEDIAQSAGGRMDGQTGEDGRMVGNFGDVSIASFYATKPWGGACGGMVMSSDADMCERVRHMRCADTAGITLPYAGNHQLSDIHAALARVRLSQSNQEREYRMRQAVAYDEWFMGIKSYPVKREVSCNHYRYIVRVDDASGVIEALHSHGVGAARPVEEPLSRLVGQRCQGAEAAWQQCVSLPLLTDMSEDELDCMRKAIAACM